MVVSTVSQVVKKDPTYYKRNFSHIKCCGKDFGSLFVERDGKYFISGKLAFHWYDTHGLPIEVIEYAVTEKMKRIITSLLSKNN